MHASKPIEPAQQDAELADPAPAPTRKPRKPRAQAATGTAEDVVAPTAAEAPPAPAESAEPVEDEAGAATESDAAAEAVVPPEDLMRGDQFARMLGYRPAELIAFERKGWVRPISRENGVALYRKSDAAEIRQDLKRRRQEEGDQKLRNRRY